MDKLLSATIRQIEGGKWEGSIQLTDIYAGKSHGYIVYTSISDNWFDASQLLALAFLKQCNREFGVKVDG